MQYIFKMWMIIVALFYACISTKFQGQWPVRQNSTNYKAVLIAGSNGWMNYRHQADVFHAYSELIANGISPKDIILFAYNDIVYNTMNPTPGVVINQPGGPNIYPGNESVTFAGDDVTPENFLNTLLNLSSPDLDLLIYFSDHGGPGLICFPNDYLYVDQLKKVILSMQYHSLFFALESCESGSMFDGWFPNNTQAFALSASNPYQDSYACYNDDNLGTYLGDCFSVNMLQFVGPGDTFIETIGMLAIVVLNQTTTSPVTTYGDATLFDTTLDTYWGTHLGGAQNSFKQLGKTVHVPAPSWDVPRRIGIMTQGDSRFDWIRSIDRAERDLYNRLKYFFRIETGFILTNYRSPVNSQCIRLCMEILSASGIKLTGYSTLFTKDIATLCDKVPERVAVRLIERVGFHAKSHHI
jgi:hypothetical protein